MVKIHIILAIILVLKLVEIQCERFGYNNRFTCHCASNARCDKTTGVCSTGSCQKGWSGPSCQRQNVALNKPATQSSYYHYYAYPGVSKDVLSGYAVDGDRSHGWKLGLNPGQSKCVFGYSIGTGAVMEWWSVDLLQTYPLHTIKIYHRDYFLDRFTGASVYIIDEHGRSTKCYENNRQPTSSEFTVSCNGIGRYLNFTQSTGEHILDLCEVEVYVCSNGTFGVNCSSFCHCEGEVRCDEVTGHCYGNCSPGWTGSSCNQSCYGENCSKLCDDRHCRLSSSCDDVTGYCNGGCEDGWQGDDCYYKCYSGYYGSGCSKRCSHRKCKYSSYCDHVTGKCSNHGCKPGWDGEDCTNRCPRGSYGISCKKNCSERHCKGSTTCFRSTGRCRDGCQPGWTDNDCTRECPEGTFGENCLGNCSRRHCKGSTSCSHVTGYCQDGCLAGYVGDTCEKECESGFYGEDCQSNCSDRKCLNTTSACDHVTGQCNGGCIEEYYGMDCSVFKEKMVTTSDVATTKKSTENITTVQTSAENVSTVQTSTPATSLRNDVRCTKTSIKVFIPLKYAKANYYILRDPRCGTYNNGTHLLIEFKLGECGTQFEFRKESLVFSNQLKEISDSDEVISIQCEYPRHQNVSLRNSSDSSTSKIFIFEKGRGVDIMTIQQFKTSHFEEPITPSLNEDTVKAGELIYMMIAVEGVFSKAASVGVIADSCTVDPMSGEGEKGILLVENNCEKSTDVKIYKTGKQFFQFHFPAPSFSAGGKVQVSCQVFSCNKKKDCYPNCNRKRRSIRSKSDSVFLRSEPIFVGETSEKHISKEAIATACLSVLSVVLLIAVIVLVKDRHNFNNQAIVKETKILH